MDHSHKRCALSYNDEAFSELFDTNVLVNVTKNICQEREFNGEYYGIPNEYTDKISNERNEYLSMLTIIADKLKIIHKLHMSLEQELNLLYQNADNRS